MADYAIGDIQGCFDEWMALLDKIHFQPESDHIWLLGDVVNRGPKSLETLRFIKDHSSSIHMILGNHDLHLLAIAAGGGRLKKQDTLSDILFAPDRDALLDWLRQQPLLRQVGDSLLVHAGILPSWSTAEAFDHAAEVENMLQGKHHRQLLQKMYGNSPAAWQDDLSGMDRLRCIMNVFTRMRVIDDNECLDFAFKSIYAEIPPHLKPWFKVKPTIPRQEKIIFGHWSALGLYQDDGVTCLDTGALWGGELSAMDLASGAITQVAGR